MIAKSPSREPLRQSDEHGTPHGVLLAATWTPPSIGAQHAQAISSRVEDEDLFNLLYDDAAMVDFDISTIDSFSAPSGSPTEILLSQQVEDTSRVLVDPTHIFNIDDPADSRNLKQVTSTLDLDQWMELENRHSNPNCLGTGSSGVNFPVSDLGYKPAIRMQQLMQLGSLMYELQSKYSHSENDGLTTSIETFPADLAGKVLQAADEFLQCLRHFFLSEEAISPLINGSSTANYSSEEVTNNGLSGNHQMFSDTVSRSSIYRSSASPEWQYRRVHPVDKPTALQLIANYLRLLQLFILLYSRVCHYISCAGSDLRQAKPIWDDLSIGGAPLNQFADFQIKFVLQVAAKLLGEVEAALGLHEGCRVSKKPAAEGSGILCMNVTAHFVEMCMSEVSTETEQGRGAIGKLRDLIECAMDMLDAAVWF
ncbi:uncharacterized protein JN550_006855 [Neoarthrinium moseri]|uniref:uncharacterized protein n=1 Tax=Neoarthrinium moseri TaxID=1658444 RepID=UPI001FDD5FE0|nr:uncharacterized protein JN550_006855 [Neoarthrinium moseri]KAI1867714.1 hypothetical protein JN550_006855 [Neoarthrinium moseri]